MKCHGKTNLLKFRNIQRIKLRLFDLSQFIRMRTINQNTLIMEQKVVYVASYKLETRNNEMETVDGMDCVLNAFTDAKAAKEYAEEYYNNACGENANMSVRTSKKGYLNIKITDKVLVDKQQDLTEYRTLKIERVIMCNSDVVTDIRNKVME